MLLFIFWELDTSQSLTVFIIDSFNISSLDKIILFIF